MTKNKKLTLIFVGIAFLFALVAIFMGFAQAVKETVDVKGTEPNNFTLFDLMFKSYSDRNAIAKAKGLDELVIHRQGVLIIGFVALLLSTLSLGTTGILNLVKKSNKKINISLLSVSIALLIVSAVVILCVNPIVGWSDEHKTAYFTIKHDVKAGVFVWCAFSMISMIFAALAIDRVKKDNVVKANA